MHEPIHRGISRWLAMGVSLCLVFCSVQAGEDFGYTEALHYLNMSFSEPGVITAIKVKEGDKVKQGQVLAHLDIGVLEKELQIAKELSSQRKFRMEKLLELKEQGRVSPEEMERATSDLNIEELKIQRAEAQIQARSIVSPIDGVVSDIKRDVGESVSMATGTIITVVQLDKLVVNMYVSPEKLLNIRAGSTRTLYFSGGRDSAPAKVEFVSPVTDPATKTVRVKFVIPNTGNRIASGVRCTLEPPVGNPGSKTTSKKKKKKDDDDY